MSWSSRCLVGFSGLLLAAEATAAEPKPATGPIPAWVVPAEIPQPNPAKRDAPLQFLLTSSQQKFSSDGVETYVEIAAVPQNTVGLQALGNMQLPWNAELTDMTIHKAVIKRGQSTVDLLKPNELLVLRRENNLEKAVLDGVRTVVIAAPGLQPGDVLNLSASYKPRKSSIAGKPEEVHDLTAPMAIRSLQHRFLVPDSVTVAWKVDGDSLRKQVVDHGGLTEHIFTQEDVEPLTVPNNAPARFKTPLLQVSAYSSWAEVAKQLKTHFDNARRPAPASPLVEIAKNIAAETADPAKRMLAALRLTQDQVRYVALLLGEGAYKPSSADETWERRFGDCKGKTVLLLALLDQLGIAAEPMLVSTNYDDRLESQLPSLALFDHVIVRAMIDGRQYFLDATDFGQRTIDELTITPFSHGLAMREVASLEKIVEPPLKAPLREVNLVWDASAGTDSEAKYDATLVFRGAAAADMRRKLSAATDMKEFDTELKDFIPTISNDDLVMVEKIPDAPDGSFTVRFSGKSSMDWSPFEGDRNARFAFSNNTIYWNAEFGRNEGPGKDWPVWLNATRYWEKLTETVILPDSGKGYSIDAEPLDRSIAGSSISRSINKEGNRIISVSEFRHNSREISAEEARTSEGPLAEIGENWAYVVGPPERKKRR